MFKNVFSFEGRIRRLEYGLSYIFYYAYDIIVSILIERPLLDFRTINSDTDFKTGVIFFLSLLLAIYFMIAQGAKRCHDRGNSGWWMLIPFYGLWMLFADGDVGDNEYGPNPKGIYYEYDDSSSSSGPIDDVDEDGVIINNK